MMVRIVFATANKARRLPRFRHQPAILLRQVVSLVWEAAQATCVMRAFSHGFALRVLLDIRLPAL